MQKQCQSIIANANAKSIKQNKTKNETNEKHSPSKQTKQSKTNQLNKQSSTLCANHYALFQNVTVNPSTTRVTTTATAISVVLRVLLLLFRERGREKRKKERMREREREPNAIKMCKLVRERARDFAREMKNLEKKKTIQITRLVSIPLYSFI